MGREIGRDGEKKRVMKIGEMKKGDVDMRKVVIIG